MQIWNERPFALLKYMVLKSKRYEITLVSLKYCLLAIPTYGLHSLHVNIAESIVRGHHPSCVHSRLMVNEQTKKHHKKYALNMINLITSFLQSCPYFSHIPTILGEGRSNKGKNVHLHMRKIFPEIWETVLFWYS